MFLSICSILSPRSKNLSGGKNSSKLSLNCARVVTINTFGLFSSIFSISSRECFKKCFWTIFLNFLTEGLFLSILPSFFLSLINYFKDLVQLGIKSLLEGFFKACPYLESLKDYFIFKLNFAYSSVPSSTLLTTFFSGFF